MRMNPPNQPTITPELSDRNKDLECKKCGWSNPIDSKFCNRCGPSLSTVCPNCNNKIHLMQHFAMNVEQKLAR